MTHNEIVVVCTNETTTVRLSLLFINRKRQRTKREIRQSRSLKRKRWGCEKNDPALMLITAREESSSGRKLPIWRRMVDFVVEKNQNIGKRKGKKSPALRQNDEKREGGFCFCS